MGGGEVESDPGLCDRHQMERGGLGRRQHGDADQRLEQVPVHRPTEVAKKRFGSASIGTRALTLSAIFDIFCKFYFFLLL